MFPLLTKEDHKDEDAEHCCQFDLLLFQAIALLIKRANVRQLTTNMVVFKQKQQFFLGLWLLLFNFS